MEFHDKLHQIRKQRKLTQQALADKSGLTLRAIQYYEKGERKPRNFEIVKNLANALDVKIDDLIDQADTYIIEAQEKGGSRAAKDVEILVKEISGLFAGGELPEDAVDGAMQALTDAYWKAKKINKKYTPKKYRKE